MKMGQSLRCLFWATLYCVLYLVSASDDELMDFDFSDLKEIDWNFDNDNDNSQEMFSKGPTTAHDNVITFDDDVDLMEDNQVHPFDWREKMLRTALSKALTNRVVRQKFIEVMPILRVLSRQQKLALSALITAQISAKKGHELKLDQVRMMFGDDKSLILPIVYDIANLVRNSAKKYIEFDYSLADLAIFANKQKVDYERRKLDLTSAELAEDDANVGVVGTIPVVAEMPTEEDGLEDFMVDMSDEYLDPMEINKELLVVEADKHNATTPKTLVATAEVKKSENVADFEDDDHGVAIDDPIKINQELQKDVPTLELIKGSAPSVASLKVPTKPTPKSTTTTTPFPLRRTRRSTENMEFVHKLIRSVPSSVNEADMQRGLAGRTLKLNTTAFATPKETTLTPVSTPSAPTEESAKAQDEYLAPYQLAEDIAFASLNGSEITLTEEEEVNENNAATTDNEETQGEEEALPTPEELIAGPRYRVSANKLINMRPAASAPKGKRVPPPKMRARPPKGSGVPPPKKCERFTASMCIRTEDYPMELIMGSIRRHRNAMTALLAEYIDKPYSMDTTDDFEDYVQTKKRRQDNNEIQTGLCQSIVRYARPQKARSASGEWKFIVNTGQHTQTLRLEKCTNPQETCSYLSSNYKSHCSQVYNYHRLLSWDKTRGLHVDIFKVPTCCSCQINGFKQQQFAAALSSFTKKDFMTSKKPDHHRNEAHDYDDEDNDDEDFGFSLRNHQHYKHDASFDANELLLGSSSRVRTKVPSPTVGSYLSPPGSEEFEQYPFKLPRDSQSIFKPSAPSSSSSSSSASSNTFLRELARRRPHKSFNDYHSDLEFAPSEQHAEREAVATTALRPSPLAPEPFVPSHPSQSMSQQQDDLASLIPMPTKSHHQPQLTPYQQRSPMEPHYPNHQYSPQHHPSGQHHYQPITTPMHQESASKPSQGYASHSRPHQGSAKRHLQRLPPKRPNTLRRHRSARLYRL